MRAFVTASGLLAVTAAVREAAAQATPPSVTPPPGATTATGDSGGIVVALALVGALLLIVGIGVKVWDAKRKREAEAVHLQSQLSDALLREPNLFSLAITPTVHAPLRRGGPMRIEATGQAPSAAARDTALRIVRDEAARVGVNFEIDDRVEIRPEAVRRIA